MYYLKKIPFSVDVIYTKVVTGIRYSKGMIRMEVIFAGIFLVIVGIFVCCLNYSIENKIVEKETEKNKKIVTVV
jgi:vacuolar-type H+-ATPase subunit I/STV1